MSTDEFESMLRSATAHIEAMQGAAAKMAELRGLGEAADGKVRVEVQAGGVVQSLEIDPRAMRMASADLSAAVLEAIQLATEDAGAKLAEILETAMPGAGAGLAGLTDPSQAAEGADALQSNIDGIIESLQRSLREGL
ncbi:YbaB/EbfC family nucleoid-associated protein [Actinopolymorpha pittospori]